MEQISNRKYGTRVKQDTWNKSQTGNMEQELNRKHGARGATVEHRLTNEQGKQRCINTQVNKGKKGLLWILSRGTNEQKNCNGTTNSHRKLRHETP